VVPGEVEATLLGHPAVAEAAVVGVAHAELARKWPAFVTLRRALPRRPERADRVLPRAWPAQYPRRITIVNELPKSATGKILKAKLRE